ncbi:MAG: penicillin-binding protein 2 [Aerococcaceae bacterium]|nr:penicillin-binding protein 2 [Aerococcaceae bacterium]
MQRQTNNPFLKYFTIVVLIAAVGLAARFAQLSLFKRVNGEWLSDYGRQSSVGRSSIMQIRRGTIYDAKASPIVMDTTSYTLVAILQSDWDKNFVKDPDVTAATLSRYVDLSRDEILERLLNPDAYQVEFGDIEPLTAQTKKAIEAENLPGITFVSQSQRQYVNPIYASHLIGYTMPTQEEGSLSATIIEGQTGIEYAYNDALNGRLIPQQDALVSGEDIYLTLDTRLQNQLEGLMNEYQQRYQPAALQVYLVEMETGKMIAAAQRPTFDLNTLTGIEAEWKNLLIEEAYEPGSTVKMLTTAVAYDKQLFSPTELFQSGSINVYDQVVKDHNQVGWGAITFEEGFARSSNVAMVNLVNRMGDDVWATKLLEFGFGQQTDFGLANESLGSVVFDSPVTRTMSGFGQGFSATPIQLLQAYSAIGNNGTMLKIQVINGIGQNSAYQVKSLGQPISSDAANYVLNLMIDTVEKPYGTASAFKHPTMRVAAKTGTAQIADPNGTGYLTGENDYYHSATVFFPAEQPKYMMYLAMKQPQQTYGMLGSQILGQLFNRFVNTVMIGQ